GRAAQGQGSGQHPHPAWPEGMSWVLHRVDDRLIHGQVVIAWGHRLNPRTIWVVDDASAANSWERDLLQSAAPGVEVRVLTVAEAAARYGEVAAAAGPAFLVVRDLGTARALVEAGAAIPSFNLGGLHYAPGKEKVNEYIYLDESDRSAARALAARGVALVVQDVPASRAPRLRALVERDQVELWGGGFFEPILPAIPEPDRRGQVRAMADWLELELGSRPRGAWLAERVWEPGLASSLAAAGVEYTAVDDAHFVAAGFERDALWGHYLTEDQGLSLKLFPIHRELRYRVP